MNCDECNRDDGAAPGTDDVIAIDDGSSAPPPVDELGARRAHRRAVVMRRKRHEWIFLGLAVVLIVALMWGE